MFRSSALFLTLIHFLHLTLAVPNPDNGALSRDPAATVGLFSKVNEIAGRTAPADTTEFATTGTDIAPLAESTTTDTIVPQEEEPCAGTDLDSPFTSDIVVAWNDLVMNRGESLCTDHVGCKVFQISGSAAITVFGHPEEITRMTCKEVAKLIEKKVGKCHKKSPDRERMGVKAQLGNFKRSYVKITDPDTPLC